MSGIDLIVPVSADQDQVPEIGPGQQVLEQVERRRVEPLQVVEEQRQRMFRARKNADETPKHELEAALRLLRRKIGNRGLVPYDELEFGDEVDDELAVLIQRLQKGVAPAGQLRVAPAE